MSIRIDIEKLNMTSAQVAIVNDSVRIELGVLSNQQLAALRNDIAAMQQDAEWLVNATTS